MLTEDFQLVRPEEFCHLVIIQVRVVLHFFFIPTRKSFFVDLLPFVDQSNVASRYDPSKHFNDPINTVAVQSRIHVTQCPSDLKTDPFFPVGDPKGNYGLNWGQFSFIDQRGPDSTGSTPYKGQKGHAPFFIEYGATFNEIIDGSTNTLCFLEMRQAPQYSPAAPSLLDRRGRLWNDDSGTYQISMRLPPNSPLPDFSRCIDRPDLALPCTTIEYMPLEGPNTYLTSRSRHPGGVCVSMCDGSAKFISNSVNIRDWAALSTQQGNEVISSGY